MFPNIVTIVGNFAAEWDKQNHTYNNLLTTKPPEITIVTHRSISLNKTWLKPYIRYLKLLVRHLQQKYDSYSIGVPAIVLSTNDDQKQICHIKFV